jgi:nucleotide-binding universal stress UspA family protein
MVTAMRWERAARRDTETGLAQVSRVIVGVDDTDAGLAALRRAVELARANGVPLVAVRSWALGLPRHGGRRLRHLVHKHLVLYFSGQEQEDAAAELIRDVLRRAVGSLPAGLDLTVRTPAGDPAVALTAIAGEPGDILVIGHRVALSARGIVHGSVTAYCVRHARCPVEVVAPDKSFFRRGHVAA